MRVLVCGGRNYADAIKVDEVLKRKIGYAGHPDLPRDTTIIVGCARGADTLAERWADAAGPTLVIAFPGGRGTADMVTRARKSGIAVYEVA